MPIGLLAQNLNGFWKGTLTMTGGCFPINHIELQINVDGTAARGDSYHYLDINNYIKKDFKGSYNATSKTIVVQELDVTTYHIPQSCVVCIKRYELVYSVQGNVETLSGTWTGHIKDTDMPCQPGTITLSRIKESAFKEIPEVKVDTGELRLDFYDNGEIDGDTITVTVNKKVIVAQQRLGLKPITVFVKIDLQNTFQQIEMLAENLGSIPPNTALLIITAGKKRYQLFLTSTEVKTAAVRFVYSKDAALEKDDP